MLEIDQVVHGAIIHGCRPAAEFLADVDNARWRAPTGAAWGQAEYSGAMWRLGDWEVLGRIARGSTADVWVARPLTAEATAVAARSSGRVALKRLYPHLVEDPDLVHMFLDEFRLLARIDDPRVLAVHDLLDDGETYVAVLELVDGPSMSAAQRLANERECPVPVEVAVAVVAQIAHALVAVHAARSQQGSPLELVHRDINPPNILVSRDGEVKLCDFGVARSLPGRSGGFLTTPSTSVGMLKGKASFLAPEQLTQQEHGQAVDIYALGASLYLLLTGESPFGAVRDSDLFHAILHDEVRAPSTFFTASTPALRVLDTIVLRAMARAQDERPSAQELADALGEWLRTHEVDSRAAVARFIRRLGIPSLTS